MLLNLSCSLFVPQDFPAGVSFKLNFRLLKKVLCNHKSADERPLCFSSLLIIGLANFQLTRDVALAVTSRELELLKYLYYAVQMQPK